MGRRLLESRWFYIAAAVSMIGLALAFQVHVRTNPRPLGTVADIEKLHGRKDLNVLFILIDTLRADRLSSYGYKRPTSPHLDALAADGVRFANQLSQSSWTKCSMASLWTGVYPARTGVTRAPQALSQDARLPAEILHDAGYRTFGIWRNGWVSPSFGFSQGFDVYLSPRASPVPASVRRRKPTVGMEGTDRDVLASAVELLRTHGREHWFLYLHLMDVHQYVYDEDSALFGSTYSDIYDNAIHWVDRIVGTLVGELDSRGLRDHTLVVVAADHGEAFGEHGREGHARDVYGEVTTPPFIMSLPFRLEPGIVIQTPTQNVDIWPTLLDLLGLPALKDTDGRSRVPELLAAARGKPVPESDGLRFAEIDQTWGRRKLKPSPMVEVSEGRYRLFHRADGTPPELYDQVKDPREQVDLAKKDPQMTAKLSADAEAYLARSRAPWAQAPEVQLDEKQLDELRALGYAPK